MMYMKKISKWAELVHQIIEFEKVFIIPNMKFIDVEFIALNREYNENLNL